MEKEKGEKNIVCRMDEEGSERHLKKKREVAFKVDMVGKVSKMHRRAKFIKRTLDTACEGNPLSRKSILTLRNFFDDAIRNLDLVQNIITCDVLDDLLYPRLIIEGDAVSKINARRGAMSRSA